ncbi:AsnC family transcriptional regulator [Comamonas sp. BIGb0124]|uniref:Lrp/AsnC family transcriptional regulator n=1 Tax=Comamonas sp. BIGb0124 TaxID=2485130 RepID=UPI000F48F217|nr:Lrp/AsnC family transcriptional regulator [Comamonas sp. BIGb0124]ROR24873.1 AsnC family transcriptional regulator [Comamonas sp. BIGb0124]
MDQIDDIDRRILRELQVNARATFDELAPAVGLSASAVLRRVKRLEASGVIVGYRAVIAPKAVGKTLLAYINVRLEKHGTNALHSPMDQFRASVQAWPEVIDCVALTGEMDFLLRVVVSDMDHFSHFISETLLRHPAVRDCRSSFVLDAVKRDVGLPI